MQLLHFQTDPLMCIFAKLALQFVKIISLGAMHSRGMGSVPTAKMRRKVN